MECYLVTSSNLTYVQLPHIIIPTQKNEFKINFLKGKNNRKDGGDISQQFTATFLVMLRNFSFLFTVTFSYFCNFRRYKLCTQKICR
jgi:hypothetical protein